MSYVLENDILNAFLEWYWDYGFTPNSRPHHDLVCETARRFAAKARNPDKAWGILVGRVS